MHFKLAILEYFVIYLEMVFSSRFLEDSRLWPDVQCNFFVREIATALRYPRFVLFKNIWVKCEQCVGKVRANWRQGPGQGVSLLLAESFTSRVKTGLE